MENALFNYTEDTDGIEPDDIEDIDTDIILTIQFFNISFLSIAFILGITGNGLLIWIAGFKMKKTVTVLWFLNLAIADFVFDIIFPIRITKLIMDEHWPFGQTMCKLVITIQLLNMSVSTSFLMIISIDRCMSVMCPVWSKNNRSPRLALTISVSIWLICFILTSPYIAFLKIDQDSESGLSYCMPIYDDKDINIDIMRHRAMIIVRFVFMFLVPFPIILICYSLMVVRLRRNKSLSRSNRPLKVIITIVLCFFCLWFPYHMWNLLEVLNVEIDPTTYEVIYSLVNCIGFFNSCVNPIVYVFVGRDFKKSLFRSIPFLLENTFKEKDDSNTDPRINQSMIETVMES
ncbi:chemerin-like receptor 1 [Dendropsophus ebraccatus]|uniref:chemerin-like receptor 1 n=1 Tax=Dendropsophus ebraccatus TaxID=150705 RepID=UPI0038310714